MTGLLRALRHLLWEEQPIDQPMELELLSVALFVGDCPAAPAGSDLVMRAATGADAIAMLQQLAELGTVHAVRVSLAPGISLEERRAIERCGRRLRVLGLWVHAGGDDWW